MGIRVELSPHLIPLTSREDQKLYGQTNIQTTAAVPKLNRQSSPKSSVAERKEQGTFASWLCLQNSNARRIPFVWHATHKPSKATPGTPDFWVGINGRSRWIEFKRDYSCELSPEQEEFRACCAYQAIEWHLVYSADEAIELVQKANVPSHFQGG
jgi:hypothetical protein